jgi:DNA-binding protein H-NS
MTTPEMLDTLEGADESTLLEMIERANALLAQRQQSRRHDAMERAASDLEAAGISPDEFVEFMRRRGKTKKAPAARPKTPRGRYVNPANPDQAYELGRGRPPKWFSELEASGQLPEPESTNAG